MKLLDSIRNIFNKSYKNLIVKDSYSSSYYNGINSCNLEFGNVIFYSILEILTDLINDVELVRGKNTDLMDFANFKRFIEIDGKDVLTRYYTDGYVVILLPNGDDIKSYRILDKQEFQVITSEKGKWKISAFNYRDDQIYVIKSSLYLNTGLSHKQFVYPYLKYINSILNASDTITERLGSVIVASPKNLNTAPTSVILTEDDKKELEEEISNNYGALRNQKQIMLLPREMNFQNISLSSIDDKMETKLRIAVEVIADTLKVPSNQIALIDANASKSLSNGSELIAGDCRKYQSFERLFNETFVRMSDDLGIFLTYDIYNKPRPNSANLNEIV